MDYLILDDDGELIDVLNFDSQKAIDKYKSANPTHTVTIAEDMIFEEDNLSMDDDDMF